MSDVNIIELGSPLVSLVSELPGRLFPLQQLLSLWVERLQLDGRALVENILKIFG